MEKFPHSPCCLFNAWNRSSEDVRSHKFVTWLINLPDLLSSAPLTDLACPSVHSFILRDKRNTTVRRSVGSCLKCSHISNSVTFESQISVSKQPHTHLRNESAQPTFKPNRRWTVYAEYMNLFFSIRILFFIMVSPALPQTECNVCVT